MSAHCKSVLLLIFVTLATELPFIHRAYFVDDHYFVTIARGIVDHPARPYDFRSDDEIHQALGWERGQPPRMVNPLLFHYYLAAVIRVWGDAVWKLRFSALLFSVLAILSMYFLGLRFVARPLYPALLMALTPAFWLTSYSLLIDSAMIGFFLAALWSFMAGLEKRSLRLIFLSGLLMGATLLTKYSGALVLVLAATWQFLHPDDRRWRGGYVAFVVALGILGLWSAWNIHAYGAIHLFASAARGVKADEPSSFYLYKALAVASFLGGGTLFLAAAPIFVWKRSRIAASALFLFMVLLAGIFMSPRGGFPWSQSSQLAFWISVSMSFFVFLSLRGWPQDPRQRFLYLWFFLGLTELIVVMPWTAGRYLLILLPPVVWLFDGELSRESWRWFLLAATATGSFLIASADQAQANVIFDLSSRLAGKDCSQGGCYYLGDTFSAYPEYLGAHGWQAAFPNQAYHPGDVLVTADYRQSAWWHLPDTLVRKPVGDVSYPSWLPIHVMDVPASAGWYASCWGALPFTLTSHPLERYDIYQIVS